jgi:putative cardiolipin synthase
MDGSRKFKSVASMALVLLLAACSTLKNDFDKPHSEALPPAVDTPSAQYIDAEKTKHDADQSGFRLLTLSTNALMSRIALADKAEHSLDLQYFVFRDDDTGRLVAQHLLKAADRGVRVRLLLDDTTMDDTANMFDALDAHENIEVRVFNPFNTHDPSPLSKAAQMLFEFRRLNRRMHNKSFIADNKVAIVGGRNIGDDYFDADEKNNFRDLDLLAIGPVVQEASRTFDAYWNDKAAFPVTAYHTSHDTVDDLAKLRVELDKHARAFQQTDYAQAAIEEMPNGPTADRRGQWFWGSAVLIADKPEKVEPGQEEATLLIAPRVKQLMNGAKSELLLISPYFVPSVEDEKNFIDLAHAGVTTRILTNSMSSTDQPAVHAHYVEHRRALLAGGVQLYELKPVAGVKQTEAQNDRAAAVSLHAKAVVVDGRYVFVGSMNMDPRSSLLNTEMGFVVDAPELAKAVGEFFTTATLPANAYRLALESPSGSGGGSGQIIWISDKDGKPVTQTTEPGVGPLSKIKEMVYQLLPIDSLL